MSTALCEYQWSGEIEQLTVTLTADLAISIPNNPGLDDGASYRLDYSPPFGYPEPNTTIASREIGDEIQFSRALPGTKYNFWLYYTNFTHHDWLTWTVTITTGEWYSKKKTKILGILGLRKGK